MPCRKRLLAQRKSCPGHRRSLSADGEGVAVGTVTVVAALRVTGPVPRFAIVAVARADIVQSAPASENRDVVVQDHVATADVVDNAADERVDRTVAERAAVTQMEPRAALDARAWPV